MPSSYKRNAVNSGGKYSVFGTPGGPAQKRLRVDTTSRSSRTQNHLILVLDQSGSMRTTDVADESSKSSPRSTKFRSSDWSRRDFEADGNSDSHSAGLPKTRWDAIFDLSRHFIRSKMHEEGLSLDSRLDSRHSGHSSVVVSLVLFADQGRLLSSRVPLRKAIQALDWAQWKQIPYGGTVFAEGIRVVNEALLNSDQKSSNSFTNEKVVENNMVLFLSDGKPGDLRANPPTSKWDQIQQTYRSYGEDFPSVAEELSRLRKKFEGTTDSGNTKSGNVGGPILKLKFLGIGDEGAPWLECLADRFDGEFIDCAISETVAAENLPWFKATEVSVPEPVKLKTRLAVEESGIKSEIKIEPQGVDSESKRELQPEVPIKGPDNVVIKEEIPASEEVLIKQELHMSQAEVKQEIKQEQADVKQEIKKEQDEPESDCPMGPDTSSQQYYQPSQRAPGSQKSLTDGWAHVFSDFSQMCTQDY